MKIFQFFLQDLQNYKDKNIISIFKRNIQYLAFNDTFIFHHSNKKMYPKAIFSFTPLLHIIFVLCKEWNGVVKSLYSKPKLCFDLVINLGEQWEFCCLAKINMNAQLRTECQ